MPTADLTPRLRELPHFARLPDDVLAQLAAASRITTHARGDQVIREGAPVSALPAVLRGGVRLYRVAPDGRVQVLHRLGPRQVFAEAAVLTMPTFPASAEATRDGTEILHVGAATFLRLFDEDRRLPRAMVLGLCAWLHRLVGRVEELAVGSAATKLARYLLDLPAHAADGALVLELPSTKREVAEHLGIAPETLSRQLRRWQDAGIVRSERARIVVLDSEALVAAAADGA